MMLRSWNAVLALPMLVLLTSPLAGQSASVPAPALTPAQIQASEALAAKYDESEAREKARLVAYAQRPLAAIIQRSFDVFSNYLIVAAEMMPESGYAFRPTADVRNFGDQINHSTTSHYSFCNQAGLPPGVVRKTSPNLAQLTVKADIVKALRESVSYCNSVLAAATEAWLSENAPRVGGTSSGMIEGMRAHAFMYNNVHDAEDYGTITTYMRMNGLVPPSSAVHPAAPQRGPTPPGAAPRGRSGR